MLRKLSIVRMKRPWKLRRGICSAPGSFAEERQTALRVGHSRAHSRDSNRKSGGTKRATGVPTWGRSHCGSRCWGLRGTPCGAAERARGAPNWGGSPCGRSHWSLRWSSMTRRLMLARVVAGRHCQCSGNQRSLMLARVVAGRSGIRQAIKWRLHLRSYKCGGRFWRECVRGGIFTR